METLLKIDSDLLEKAKILSSHKSEKLIAEEALRNYILINNIFNKAELSPQNQVNNSRNSDILDDFLELVENNKKDIKIINKNLNLTELANEVNNDIF